MRQALQARLETTRNRLAKLGVAYENAMVLTGAQISDKSRVDLPHIKHIGTEIRHLQAEEMEILSRLDDETAMRAYVPLGSFS
jgi:hypothetical protein